MSKLLNSLQYSYSNTQVKTRVFSLVIAMTGALIGYYKARHQADKDNQDFS